MTTAQYNAVREIAQQEIAGRPHLSDDMLDDVDVIVAHDVIFGAVLGAVDDRDDLCELPAADVSDVALEVCREARAELLQSLYS